MADENDVAANLDIPNEPNFIQYFNSMPKCGAELVRIFNRGEYFTIHGDAALLVANTFLNTTQALKQLGSDDTGRLSSVAINKVRYEPLLRHLLMDNNYRVEIYGRAAGKGGSKSENDWELEIKASPGCLGELEEILVYNTNAPSVSNPTVAAIHYNADNNRLYFAAVNTIDCIIHMGSFVDNSSFTLLESLIVQINPKECLLPPNLNRDRIRTMLKKNFILQHEYKPKQESEIDDIVSVLEKLLTEQCKTSMDTIVNCSRAALLAFDALLDYLNLLNDRFCYSSYHLKEIEPDSFVHLDLSSIANLHLFQRSYSRLPSCELKNVHSLYQVLNHCNTASGRKLLNTFIRQPLTNLQQIEQRLDCVEFFRENFVISFAFADNFLSKIPDITKIYKKFTNGRCKLEDVYQVYQVVDLLPLMLTTFEPSTLSESVKSAIYDQLQQVHQELEPFKQLVLKSIDFDHYNDTRELWINSQINEELSEIKTELDQLQVSAKQELESVQRDLARNFDIDRSIVKMEIDKFGFYFRVTKQYASCVFRSKQYQEIHSVKDSRFLSKGISSINEKFVDFSEQYQKLQQKYITELIEQIRPYTESILKLESVLAFTDVMVSFSKSAQQAVHHYRRPKMLPKGSGKIVLKQFRHPIIEILKDMNYVANDVVLDATEHKMYVITGPNMGGKSTLIRSVALCVLMAQIGSFVPCEEAEISIVDAIYTRISASDNPTLGLSTFMAEMVETAAIIRSATSDSLVVIDELGRSTGTFDGFGIAQGITEHLANVSKPFALFATHFHQLAMDIESVGRLAMKSSIEENGIFFNHYRAELGTCTNSFGIELAKRANMPAHIVENASAKLAQLQKSLGESYYNRVIQLLESKLDLDQIKSDNNNNSDEPSNDYNQQEQQQCVKAQIRQLLYDIDWSQFDCCC